MDTLGLKIVCSGSVWGLHWTENIVASQVQIAVRFVNVRGLEFKQERGGRVRFPRNGQY